MEQLNYQESAQFIREDLRLKTFPLAVKFLKDKADFPEKTRRPSAVLGKRITICQGVTMARNYGWTVGLSKEDLICVPATSAERWNVPNISSPLLKPAGLASPYPAWGIAFFP
jgi:uncharacterized protein (DUF169 family)